MNSDTFSKAPFPSARRFTKAEVRPSVLSIRGLLVAATILAFTMASAQGGTPGGVPGAPPKSTPAAPNQGGMTRMRIQAIEPEGTTGQLEIRFEGGPSVTTLLTGKGKDPVVFDAGCPPGATSVEAVARLTIRMAEGRLEKAQVRQVFRILSPVGPVFGGSGAFEPVAAWREFLEAEGLDPRHFEELRPEPEEAIAAAEKRLGFKLDPSHRTLLSRLGPIRSDDFFMIEPARMDVAMKQLETLWGDEAKRALSLPADVRELLGRSTMVLAAAGDGYSALIWERGEPGTAWRINQDSYSPKRMLDDAGRPLPFRAALGRVLSRLAELYLPSAGPRARITIHPGRLNVFYLNITRYAGELTLELVPE